MAVKCRFHSSTSSHAWMSNIQWPVWIESFYTQKELMLSLRALIKANLRNLDNKSQTNFDGAHVTTTNRFLEGAQLPNWWENGPKKKAVRTRTWRRSYTASRCCIPKISGLKKKKGNCDHQLWEFHSCLRHSAWCQKCSKGVQMHKTIHLQKPDIIGYFMPNLEMHIEVPDFAVIKEVYLFSVINFYFPFFGFQLSQFYSVAIDESMTFWPHFPPGDLGHLSHKYVQGQG